MNDSSLYLNAISFFLFPWASSRTDFKKSFRRSSAGSFPNSGAVVLSWIIYGKFSNKLPPWGGGNLFQAHLEGEGVNRDGESTKALLPRDISRKLVAIAPDCACKKKKKKSSLLSSPKPLGLYLTKKTKGSGDTNVWWGHFLSSIHWSWFFFSYISLLLI